jgi:hypothetical protein
MNKDQAQQLLERISNSGHTVCPDLAPWLEDPTELVEFHHVVTDKATQHAALEIVSSVTRAAGRVESLWATWRSREHGGDEVRVAANQAFAAVVQALRPVARPAAERWLDVANEWIGQLRMLAEPKP